MFEGRNGHDEGRHEKGGKCRIIVRQSVFPLVSGLSCILCMPLLVYT